MTLCDVRLRVPPLRDSPGGASKDSGPEYGNIVNSTPTSSKSTHSISSKRRTGLPEAVSETGEQKAGSFGGRLSDEAMA